MSLPRYEAYRDSGVDWLGEVPAHWEVLPFWSIFSRTKRTGHEDGELLSVYRDYGVVPKSSRDDNHNNASEDLSSYQLVEIGDLAMNKMKAWQGSLGVSDFRGIVSPAYFVYRPLRPFDRRYVHFLLRSLRYITGYLSMSKGIRVGQWDLDPEQHRTSPVLFPPLPEQRAIAAYLDRETGRIDRAVAEQRRLIALLAEKRQATISHAVTKGLDPTAPLKASGVNWLGDVPAHWEVTRLDRLVAHGRKIMYGIVLPGPTVDEGIPIVKGGDVKPGRLTMALLNRTTPEIEAPFARARLRKDDIVYSIRGTIGDAELVPAELEDANITQDVARISPDDSVNTHWLLAVMRADCTYYQLAQGSLGAAVRGINIYDLRRTQLVLPPFEEQRAIAEHVERVTSHLDTLTTTARSAIDLLLERRAALVSAAVTGKIDVRGLVDAHEMEAA